jgi:hypothetical protein
MMSSLAKRILHSTLLVLLTGLFPILALWRNNLGQIKSVIVLKPFLFTLVFTLAVFSIWLLITRHWEKAALASTLTLVFILSFGHVYNLLAGKVLFGIPVGYIKLLVVFLLVYVFLLFLLLRIKKFTSSLFLFLNLAAVLLVAFNLVQIFSFESQLKPAHSEPLASLTPSTNETLPDIYYIVLDAYARDDVLKDVIGYDNSAFLDAMRERGFYIPACAFSNYHATMLTIPSVLNYQYLDDLKDLGSSTDAVLPQYTNMILNNKIMSYLKQKGYQTVTGRGFSSFMDINNSDIYLSYFKDIGAKDDLEEQRFTSMYLNSTIYRVLSEMYKNNPEKYSHLPYWLAVERESDPYLKEASFWYYQNRYMFDSLETIPEKPGPYFVYAHIVAPHGPYVFRADGSFRYPLDTQDDKILYADVVTYLNKRVLQLVDALQKNSSVPPIIIIQADHSIHKLTKELNKHKILSAYYLPGKLNTPPYATITPVNNFRLIIRNYFDPGMELLPDTLFVKWADNDKPVPSSCDLK